jgi:hypothetical protein
MMDLKKWLNIDILQADDCWMTVDAPLSPTALVEPPSWELTIP